LLIYNNSYIYFLRAPLVLILSIILLYRLNSQCLLNKPYIGNITYYNISLRVFGIINNKDAQNIITLPYNKIGPKFNNNLYYKKIIIITYIITNKITLGIIID
jgi:hypothetical protein